MNKKIISKEVNFAGKKIILETGKLANMTNMAVKVSYGDTVVLITIVSGGIIPEIDFFPLTVNYQEKFYASGSIKSSKFQKRDARSTDDAVIAGRAIDHAIRPLFPKDFADEVQIVATVLSLDPECDARFAAMLGVSAALHASDIPWNGPTASVRIGYINKEYILNPTQRQLTEESDLDMMVSFCGSDKRFLALELEANILPEEKILGAIEFARNNIDDLFKLIKDFSLAVNPDNFKHIYVSKTLPDQLMKDVSNLAKKEIDNIMSKSLDKDELSEKLNEIANTVVVSLEGKYKRADMITAIEELKKQALRKLILDEHKRPDGRGVKEIRPISCEISSLPRTHGSALFNRGITQVLTSVTLASPSQELLIQDMYGERSKKFIHYYNFPPYASGETGKIGWPKNREIGHGMIAENALRPVMPSQNQFPYTVLLVTETLSSSGSTSMAATCASSLALMDAGVPISDVVAGIGVGLISTDDMSKYLIMTDLAYMEDAFGMLDFKMTGTQKGVTAIQCDMKIEGLPMDLLPKIFEQSKEGRLFILEKMNAVIQKPKEQVSEYAPKTLSIKIDPEKIGLVIGSSGKTIKDIQQRTNSEVSIEEDGTVVVSSLDLDNSKKAIDMISGIVKDIKPGEVYDGVVEDVTDFGAFVELVPGKTGLLHISEISNVYVDDIYKVIHPNDIVKVKVMDVSRDGKIALSKKILESSSGEVDFRKNDKHKKEDRRYRNRHN